MSDKKLTIYWLDDDLSRFDHWKEIIENSAVEFDSNAQVVTIQVTADIFEIIADWEKKSPFPLPDVFMLDHIYLEQLPHKMTGNTLAHILRRTFPDVPIISVTAMYALPNKDMNVRDVHEYTAVIHYNKLDEHIEDIFSIALDFKKVVFNTWPEFFDILKIPSSEKTSLKMAVPSELTQDWTPTKHSQLARWIRTELQLRPGFLVDELRAATFLGLSIRGFKKIQNQFESALYRGPFSTSTSPRWWQNSLRDQLFSIVSPDTPDVSQVAGRTLLSFEEEDYCKCYVSSEIEASDFVVAEAYPNNVWHVVRAQYSTTNSDNLAIPPGFEEPLIIAG